MSHGPLPHNGFGYPPMRPTPRSRTGLLVGFCAALVVAVVAGVGIWAVGRDSAPPQRDLEDMRQAFPQLLPAGEIEAGSTHASGTGFGGIGCSAQTLSDRSTIYWSSGVPRPEVGNPTAEWSCHYTNSYMIPANNTRWPYLRVLRYNSSAEVKQVTDGLVGSTEEVDVNNGTSYTNYKWGVEPKSAPRMLTVFPGDPEREQLILYSYGLGANNDPSSAELLEWWKTLPLN
ncbi:hypothetical protein [Nocardia mangyaensis]|uniref:hypothetical protein n=1 Tax=Nocardia mangyaensis TaxID=2213200 RepID=UPI00267714A6|nr:hypothetical protein [Nocardia mangyaensis]MDO3647004.1 hypothetical protein [Nocardia mangyaensis]